MDQVKIGKFIAQMRKEQNLTQRGLADKLSISGKPSRSGSKAGACRKSP